MNNLSNHRSRIRRIGFLITAKKTNSFGIGTTLSQLCVKSNIELVDINPYIDIEEQGPFDVIFHKISDYNREFEAGEFYALNVVKNLINYQSKFSNVRFIGVIREVFDLADREKMNKICQLCEFSYGNIKIFSPEWTVVKSMDDMLNKIDQTNIKFPCICKSLDASEGPGAHDMQFLFSKQQTSSMIIFPAIMQHFVNHNAILYKLFIIGSRWWVVTRPSIKNFAPSEYVQESVHFNSHDVSKPTSLSFLNNFALNYRQEVMAHNENPSSASYNILSRDVIVKLIENLRKYLSCQLLGVDLIVDSNTGYYGLVDINYLPGYDGVPNLTSELAYFLKSVVCDKQFFPN